MEITSLTQQIKTSESKIINIETEHSKDMLSTNIILPTFEQIYSYREIIEIIDIVDIKDIKLLIRVITNDITTYDKKKVNMVNNTLKQNIEDF